MGRYGLYQSFAGIGDVGMGLTLNPNDFKIVFSRPKDVIIGCLAQFIIMPVMAWVLAKYSICRQNWLWGHLGRMLPWRYCFQCHYLFGKGWLGFVCRNDDDFHGAGSCSYTIDYLDDGRNFCTCRCSEYVFSIVQVVILPIVVGFVIQKYCPRFTSRAVGYLPAFSSVAITFIVGIIVSHNAEKLLTSGLLIILVVMLHNICGLLLGFSIGKLLKLEYKKCVAISIEVGMQIRVLPVPWPLFICSLSDGYHSWCYLQCMA